MKQTQYTKGPWNVAKPNCGLGIFDENGKSVAAIAPTQKRPWAEKEANAHLIAAAPELLEALEIIAGRLQGSLPATVGLEENRLWQAVFLANKAIAKAKGV